MGEIIKSILSVSLSVGLRLLCDEIL